MDSRDREARFGKWYLSLDLRAMVATVQIGDGEASLPVRYEVCGLCDGHGKHVNPSIDADGLTASDLDELGPDFAEDYFSGVYDVRCYRCDGARVEPVVNEGEASPEVLAAWREEQEEREDYRRMVESEIAWGA